MYNGILRFIKNEYNNNWLINMNPYVYGVFWGLILGSLTFDLLLIKKGIINFLFYFIIIRITLIFYLIITKIFFPFFDLDTKRNKKIKEFRKWVFLGFLSFIIFGTLLTILRKKIFGF